MKITKEMGIRALSVAGYIAGSNSGPWTPWIFGSSEYFIPLGWGDGGYFSESPSDKRKVSTDEVLLALAMCAAIAGVKPE